VSLSLCIVKPQMERHLSKLKMSSKWHRVPIISNRMEIFVSKNAHYQEYLTFVNIYLSSMIMTSPGEEITLEG
ncbi:MAG TPA: hypothetical protein VNM45_04400, partial [Bacillus sp. (in: firmicutes)]|nr:hypothetical protein [Bacillus sp. (in: firmicutes)]